MYLQAKGKFSKQAHVAIPEGLYEEEFGRDGFFGPVTQLYHRNPPTGWTRIEGPLRPRAFNTHKTSLSQMLHSVPERVMLFYNDDVSVHLARPQHTQPWYFRNADADEIIFIHEGAGRLECDFGMMSYEAGDYLVIPRGTTTRMCPETEKNFYLIFESRTPIEEPTRGILGQHALYDPTMLETPEPGPIVEESFQREWEVKIKRLNQMSSVFYPFNPLDVEGWKGDLTVWKLNVNNICPVMSHKVHLPPSVHTTFRARGFVICTFLPRPLETEPDAVKVPFYHRNIDYDEFLFYHSGNFFSRDGIEPGMVTLHPQGIHHGPHPKAVEASHQKTHTDEIAVMLDTRQPLTPTPEANATEWAEYWQTWQTHKTGASS